MDAFFRYVSTLSEDRARRFALLGTKIFGLDPEMPAAEAAAKTVDSMVAFMDEIGVPHTLSAAGIPLSDVERIADEIVAHGCNAEGMLPSIPPIGRDGIIEILNMAK